MNKRQAQFIFIVWFGWSCSFIFSMEQITNQNKKEAISFLEKLPAFKVDPSLLGSFKENSQLAYGIEGYLKGLPTISQKAITSQDSEEKARVVAHYIMQFGDNPCTGTEELAERIKKIIDSNESLQLINLGFPVKTANPYKGFSLNADLGEFMALVTLAHMTHQISLVHNASMSIYTNEPFVHHIHQILYKETGMSVWSPAEVKIYQDSFKKLLYLFEPLLKHGDIENLNSIYESERNAHWPQTVDAKQFKKYVIFMKKEINHDKLKNSYEQQLFNNFIAGTSCENIYKTSHGEILRDVINAYKKASEEEKHTIFLEIKKQQIYKRCVMQRLNLNKHKNELGYKVAEHAYKGAIIMRNIMSQHIENYANCIRLSIHPGSNVNEKIGVDLIAGSEGTPWHKALVIGDKNVSLMHVKQAMKIGAKQGSVQVGSQTLSFFTNTCKGKQ